MKYITGKTKLLELGTSTFSLKKEHDEKSPQT